MPAATAPYQVSAYNLARQSENKMHDDTVARRYGFSGGLVPGVDVFAYMSHVPVAKWGREFLDRGRMTARFLKPVYDGKMATVIADDGDAGLSLRIESEGEICAIGEATLPVAPASLRLNDFTAVAPVSVRHPVTESSYPIGKWLGIPPYTLDEAGAAQYLRDVRESDPLYAREGLIHPGTLLRTLNWALMENAILGPWIHVGSTIRHLAAARVGDELTVRAAVTANYDRKGHRFVELDGLVVANGTSAIAHCQHVAIYQPRESQTV